MRQSLGTKHVHLTNKTHMASRNTAVPDILPDALSIVQAIMPTSGFRPRIRCPSVD